MTGVAAKIPPQKTKGGAQLADVPQRLCLMTHGCENCQARPAMDEHKNNIRIPFGSWLHSSNLPSMTHLLALVRLTSMLNLLHMHQVLQEFQHHLHLSH